MAQKGLEGHGDQDKWRRGERKRSGPCRVRVGPRELDGRRLTSLSGQGGRDSVQPGCGSCPALWSGQPVPALKLRPSDGSSAHTGTLPAPRRYHWHCQGGSCCGLWDRSSVLCAPRIPFRCTFCPAQQPPASEKTDLFPLRESLGTPKDVAEISSPGKRWIKRELNNYLARTGLALRI